MKRSLIPTGALAATITAAVLVVPGTASAAAPTTAPDPGPRIERACLRIPNLETRTNNLIQRLQGDETVRGSLAWLQVQIDRATARNRQDLVEVLQNRLAVRQQTLEVLQQRLEKLPELKQFCADRGIPV